MKKSYIGALVFVCCIFLTGFIYWATKPIYISVYKNPNIKCIEIKINEDTGFFIYDNFGDNEPEKLLFYKTVKF